MGKNQTTIPTITMKRKRKKGKNIINQCLSKTRYDNEDDAWATAIWQSQQEGCGVKGCCPIFNTYRCMLCEGYHTYMER